SGLNRIRSSWTEQEGPGAGWPPRQYRRRPPMAEGAVVYMRIPEDAGLNLPAYMREARVLLEIPEDTLRGLAADLASYAGFLSVGVLREHVAHHVGDAARAERLARVWAWTDRYLRANEQDISKFLGEIARWASGANDPPPVSPEELARIQQGI